jgi:hypothetical protein
MRHGGGVRGKGGGVWLGVQDVGGPGQAKQGRQEAWEGVFWHGLLGWPCEELQAVLMQVSGVLLAEGVRSGGWGLGGLG